MRYTPFRLGDSWALEIEVNDQLLDVAINFYNGVKTDIVAHISLRPAAGQIALNYMVNSEWGFQDTIALDMPAWRRVFILLRVYNDFLILELDNGDVVKLHLPECYSAPMIHFLDAPSTVTLKRPEFDVVEAKAILARAEMDEVSWLLAFSSEDYRSAHSDLAPEFTPIGLFEHFLTHGRREMRALTPTHQFDANLYRSEYADMVGASDEGAYWHYLIAGRQEGRVGTLVELATRLGLPFKRLDKAIDQAGLDELLVPDSESAGRPTGLRGLAECLKHRMDYEAWLPLKGGVADFFLLDLAQALYRDGRCRPAVAVTSYLLSQNGASDAVHAVQLAASLVDIRSGLLKQSLDYFERQGGLSSEARYYLTPDALEALFRQALRQGDLELADVLLQLMPLESDVEKQSAVRMAVEIRERHLAGAYMAATSKATLGDHIEAIDLMQRAYDNSLGTVPALEPRKRARSVDATGLNILQIGPSYIPQCHYYRVEQKDLLFGAESNFQYLDEAEYALEDIDLARLDILILYRCMGLAKTEMLAKFARHYGVLVIAEHDDQIFDSSYFPLPLTAYKGQITARDHGNLVVDAVGYRHINKLADRGLASTPALAEQLATQIGKPVDLLPNYAGEMTKLADRYPARAQNARRSTRQSLTIFYGSATHAHSEDFELIAMPGLIDLLDANPKASLVVGGTVKLSGELERFGPRIARLPLFHDRTLYLTALADVDIAIAPLKTGPVTEAKSAIKWMEAALMAVPAIVSDTAAMRNAVENDDVGLVCANTSQFRAALFALAEDGELRQSMGQKAQQAALQRFGVDAATACVTDLLAIWQNALPVRKDQCDILFIAESEKVRLKMAKAIGGHSDIQSFSAAPSDQIASHRFAHRTHLMADSIEAFASKIAKSLLTARGSLSLSFGEDCLSDLSKPLMQLMEDHADIGEAIILARDTAMALAAKASLICVAEEGLMELAKSAGLGTQFEVLTLDQLATRLAAH